jgi:O-acetyl-ADP-ribose deacetylase (regulator of RNase III)
MKLILVDMNADICDAWADYFQNLPNIEIVNDYFENLPIFDCMVSAANSFGLMDGGVDAAITRYFGDDLMLRVQERIIAEYFGEQPVGTSMIVETRHTQHPYIAHTPTMRVPLEIAHTDHTYLAMWAFLREIHRHNQNAERKIEVVACPALGTGYGRVPPREAARQMSLAYRNFLNPPQYISWQYASERQLKIRFGGDDGLRRATD